MRVLFLTYDVVRSCEHDREHVVACESIPQSLQPDEGLHLSSGLLFAAVCWSDNVDQFTKFIGIVATVDESATSPPPLRSCRYVSPHRPTPHFSAVANHNTLFWGLHITTDDMLPCAHMPIKFWTTAPHPLYIIVLELYSQWVENTHAYTQAFTFSTCTSH